MEDVVPTEVLNNDPMDLEGGYVDVEDELDQHPSKPLPPKRDTKGEALSLYDAWKDLIPSLVQPFLTYTNKSPDSKYYPGGPFALRFLRH
jgi:hypothetical protein